VYVHAMLVKVVVLEQVQHRNPLSVGVENQTMVEVVIRISSCEL